MSKTYFFRDRPMFGLEVGSHRLSLMQIDQSKGKPVITAYGECEFDPKAIVDGAVVMPELIVDVAKDLLNNQVKGHLASRRVTISVPALRTYSRAITLPPLEEKELHDAVLLEAEQYIPVSIEKLYLDYTVISRTAKEIELFMVAAPKQIIDSLVGLAELLGLEPVAIETSIHAASRLFAHTDKITGPTVLIDFGRSVADITIVHKTILATGTVSSGGDNFTARIAKYLGVTPEVAHEIKTSVGLSYSNKQRAITDAINPELDLLYKEIRRMIRYFEERYPKRKINQIVLMGAANMPGLSDHMTNVLRLPVRNADPWQKLSFDKAPPLPADDRSRYLTAAGLALITSEKLFA